jgi:hypothetical protein
LQAGTVKNRVDIINANCNMYIYIYIFVYTFVFSFKYYTLRIP